MHLPRTDANERRSPSISCVSACATFAPAVPCLAAPDGDRRGSSHRATGIRANVSSKRARHAAGLRPAVSAWALAGRAGTACADRRRPGHHAGTAHDGSADRAGRARRRGSQRRAVADRGVARQLLRRQPGAQDHRATAPQAGRRQPPTALHRNHPQARVPAAAQGGISRRLSRCGDGHAGVGTRQPVCGAAGVRSRTRRGLLRPQPCDCAGAGRDARAIAQPARAGAGERCQRLRQDLVAARRRGAVAGAARRAGWAGSHCGGVLQPGAMPWRRCARHAGARTRRLGGRRARGVFAGADGGVAQWLQRPAPLHAAIGERCVNAHQRATARRPSAICCW